MTVLGDTGDNTSDSCDPGDLELELQRRLTALAPLIAHMPSFPSSRPVEGQSDAAWRSHVARRRAEHDAMALVLHDLEHPEQPDIAAVPRRWLEVDGPGGPIGTRWYGDEHAPMTIVTLHGGAFWMGGGGPGFDMNDAWCTKLCAATGAAVVSVDYRLAPEHRFPAQSEDAGAVLEYAAEDTGRVAIAGISSGGFVALDVARRSRNGDLPPLAFQLLIQPAIDLGPTKPTPDEADRPDAAVRRLLAEYYLADEPDWAAPNVTAANDPDLVGFPTTILVTGDADPLAGPARSLAARLCEAGVAVTDLRYVMTHTVAPPSERQRMLAEVVEAIESLL